ncbi:MAG: hypothetical protein AABW82_03940 [Nanoarchaeota archaeon]
MADEYGFSERRKNKNDKRAKGKFNRYKTGGKHRSDGLAQVSVSNENNRKS